MVLKPPHGGGGLGITLVANRTQLDALVHGTRPTRSNGMVSGKEMIIQEAVRGTTEWGVYWAAYRGRLLRAVCLRYEFHSTLFVRKATSGDGYKAKRKTREASTHSADR